MILSWKAPTYYNEQLIGSYDAESGSYETEGSNFEYLSLLTGKPYPESMEKPKIFFPCNEKKLMAYDCLWLLGGVPLVSRRLGDFLVKHASQDIELLTPTSITADGKVIGEGYYVVNAVQSTSAIDYSKSVAEYDDDGSILYFTKTWFQDSIVEMHAIARERDSGDLLISQELAEAMIESKFKGDKGLGFYIADRSFTPYKNQA